jgi:hypothetical protein
MNRHKSIELDILEEAVENAPLSVWTIVDYVGRLDTSLDQVGRLRAARDLVKGMVNKGWVRVVETSDKSEIFSASPHSVLPENEWERGGEGELRKFVVVATAKGEATYLSH